MVHFNLSTRVNLLENVVWSSGHYKGPNLPTTFFWQIKHCTSALIQMTMTVFKVSACPLQTIIPAFAFSPLGLFRFSSAVFNFTFGGDFIRFHFVENGFAKTSRNGEKASLWTYALTFSPSEVLDNSVWLTWCYKTSHDVNCKPVIITRPTITCSTVVFSLHARTMLLAKSPCCCLKIKDGFRPPKIRLKTVRIRDGIGKREGSHRPLRQITGVFFSLGFSTIWEPFTG